MPCAGYLKLAVLNTLATGNFLQRLSHQYWLSRAVSFSPLLPPLFSGTSEPWSILAEREAHQAVLYCHAMVRFLPMLPPGGKVSLPIEILTVEQCSVMCQTSLLACPPKQPHHHLTPPFLPPDWTNCITYPLGAWQWLNPDATGAGEFPAATEAGLHSSHSSVHDNLTQYTAGTALDEPLSGPPSPHGDFSLDSFLARSLCSIIVCQ